MSNELESKPGTPPANPTSESPDQGILELDEPNGPEGYLARYQEFSSGPFPPPMMLKVYDQVLPGAAERIFAMAEKEQDAEIADRKAGRNAALFVTTLCMGTSVGLAALGATVAAGIVGGSTVVGLAAIFVLGKVIGARSERRALPEPQADSEDS